MQESIVFLLRVQCRRKESSRSLSYLLMSFLSFAARHVNCWNALPGLPNSVRCGTSLSSFKRLLCTCTCDLTPFLRSKCDF